MTVFTFSTMEKQINDLEQIPFYMRVRFDKAHQAYSYTVAFRMHLVNNENKVLPLFYSKKIKDKIK